MAKPYDLTPLSRKQLKILQKDVKGGSPYQPFKPDKKGFTYHLPNKAKKRNGLKIAGFLRPSGSGALTNKEFERALKIINTTSPNEKIRQEREDILIQQSRFGP